LQQLSQQQGVTLFMTLVSCFKVLLHRYSGQQNICIGTPVANRTRREIEELVVFFVNILILRNEINSNKVFIDFLQQVRVTTLEAYQHQDVHFENMVHARAKEMDVCKDSLFQVMFILEELPQFQNTGSEQLKPFQGKYERQIFQFDLTFFIKETSLGLEGSVIYSTELFSEKTIMELVSHFEILLSSIVNTPEKTIATWL